MVRCLREISVLSFHLTSSLLFSLKVQLVTTTHTLLSPVSRMLSAPLLPTPLRLCLHHLSLKMKKVLWSPSLSLLLVTTRLSSLLLRMVTQKSLLSNFTLLPHSSTLPMKRKKTKQTALASGLALVLVLVPVRVLPSTLQPKRLLRHGLLRRERIFENNSCRPSSLFLTRVISLRLTISFNVLRWSPR